MNREMVALLALVYVTTNNGMEKKTNIDNSKINKKPTVCCTCDNEAAVSVFENIPEEQISVTPKNSFGKNYLKITLPDDKNFQKLKSKIHLHFEDKDGQKINDAFHNFKNTDAFIEDGTALDSIKKTIFSSGKNGRMDFSFCIIPQKDINYKTINIYISCEGSDKKIYINKAQEILPSKEDNQITTYSSETETNSETSIVKLINEKGVQKQNKDGYFTIIFPDVPNIVSIKNKLHIYVVDENNNPVNGVLKNYSANHVINSGDKVSSIKATFLKSNSEINRSFSVKYVRQFSGTIYFQIEGYEEKIMITA